MDAFLNWRETYAVGHHGLDSEHKRLVALINEIAGGASPLLQLSSAFYLASVAHFRHENAVMRDILDGAYLLSDNRVGRPAAISEAAINDHCAEHARSLIKLERMLQSVLAAENAHRLLASELKAWFLDHAINHDAHLMAIFRSHNDRLSNQADFPVSDGQAKLGQRPDRPGC